MTLENKDRYEIGESTIDEHHREIFQLISILDRAVSEQDNQGFEKFICFLETELLEHFEEEESLMSGATYYNSETFHKTEHEIFRVKVKQLRELFERGGSRAHFVFTARRFIDRLIDHILTVDSGLEALV